MIDHARTVDLSDRTPRVGDVVTVDARYLRAEFRHVARWEVEEVDAPALGGGVHLVSPGGKRTHVFRTALTREAPAREARAATLW